VESDKPRKRSRVRLVIYALLAIVVVGWIATAGDDNEPTPSGDESTASADTCDRISATELSLLVDGWTGSGSFSAESAMRTEASGSDTFTHVVYVQGTAAGLDSEVFTFATSSVPINGGLIVGADSLTREFFEWGAAATPGSPAAEQAATAVQGSTRCLP